MDKPKISTDDIMMLLKMLDSVEKIKGSSFMGKFEYLKGRIAQVERILFGVMRNVRVARMTEISHNSLVKTVRSKGLEPD